ncbi:MAG: efflux RND transporter periplasmic adaptor subunit [Bauldia litoralis]|uniref:efflux RND transporter periplasmic adaptor subunit n=1 Tax=Bauldia litoralis TaxID=665467 RepID=UPI003299CF91
MASIFKPSRVISVAILLAAAGWIASGVFSPANEDVAHGGDTVAADGTQVASLDGEPPVAGETAVAEAEVFVQRVSVRSATPEPHQRQIVLSCTTEADNASVAVARGAGVIVELNVERGSKVRADEVVAKLSDEGRVAAVKQAEALLLQRQAEYDANKSLIDKGNAPKNQLPALEAAVASAEATLATANALADRSIVRSPVGGVVDSVPVQVGQAVEAGSLIAEIIDPDPMLAVGAVSERERGYLDLGQSATMRFIDGKTVDGEISYVGLSADKATRTYPVEARMANPGALIPDGVTCEMVVTTEPVIATSIPRSALVFSDDGLLGVRLADENDRVQFKQISIVDDGRDSVWVAGIDEPTRIIIVGQDFVKDGDLVEPVSEVAKVEPPA